MAVDKQAVESALDKAKDAQDVYYRAISELEKALGCDLDEIDVTSDDLGNVDADWLIDLVNPNQ